MKTNWSGFRSPHAALSPAGVGAGSGGRPCSRGARPFRHLGGPCEVRVCGSGGVLESVGAPLPSGCSSFRLLLLSLSRVSSGQACRREEPKLVLTACGNAWKTFVRERITECSGLAGTSVGHLVQPPCRSRATYSRLHRTLSRRVLNISREGDKAAYSDLPREQIKWHFAS